MVLPSARQLSFLFTADKTLSIFVISTGEEMKMMLHTKRGVEMYCTDTVSGKAAKPNAKYLHWLSSQISPLAFRQVAV